MDTADSHTNMGRPRLGFTRKYFIYDSSTDYSYCKIPGCNGKVKKNHHGNLEKHLQARHPDAYANIVQEKGNATAGKRQRSKSLSVAIDIEDLNNACVELVTVNGRPLSIIDDSGFRKIIEPLLIASDPAKSHTLSSAKVRNMVEIKAKDIRESIRDELKGKMINLKVDAATRHDRGFLGINVQFIADGIIHIRTLGIIELTERHTAEYLGSVIQKILDQYGIDISNIYSFTSDNGANMIKLGKLLSEKQMNCTMGNEEQECEEDEVDEVHCDRADGQEDPFSEEETTRMPLDESEACQLSNGSALISNIRCAAHTLQLAIYDALKATRGTKDMIAKARMVAKALRKPTIRQTLLRSIPTAKKAPLDVPTRWNSTTDMLQYLIEMRSFCEDFASPYQELHLTDEEWLSMENYLKALMPSKIATLQLQAEQLTLSSFYGIWMECKFITSEMSIPLAQEVVKAMDKREPQLMENDALLASVYLDPRYLDILPAEHHEKAIAKLEQVWQKIEALSTNSEMVQLNLPADNRSTNSVMASRTQRDQSALQSNTFRSMCAQARAARVQKLQGPSTIRRLLESYRDTAVLDVSSDVLHYWESKRNLMPQLYKLATIVHAAPATQVSVERLFSAMHFIFSTLRANLKSQILDDIIIVRCNHQNTKRGQRNVAINTQRRRRRTESNVSASTSSDASTSCDDLALEAIPIAVDVPEEPTQVISCEIPFDRL